MHLCRGNYRGQWFNDEASRLVPIENLSISPQCGFASEVQGNPLTWDDQRRKLDLVVSTAQRVRGLASRRCAVQSLSSWITRLSAGTACGA